VFITGLLFRSRVYCDYLCPFAAVQEAIYAVSGRRARVSDRVWRGCTFARHVLLFVIAILVAVGGYHAVGAMEPYIFLFNPGSEILPWIYVAVAIVAAFFVRRFWCRVFCPCGACVELVASIRGRRANREALKRDQEP
jgi:polyferredoxin